MTKRKKTDIVPLMVRLREGLRGQIEAAAKARERSLNSEIVARLEESFTRAELASLTENVDRLSGLYERARASDELTGKYRLYADKCSELAQRLNDQDSKLALLSLANAWLALAAHRETNVEAASANKPMPKEPLAETFFGRPVRLAPRRSVT